MTESIKLTAYSHGAGCGCKIAPDRLEEILQSVTGSLPDPALLVGNDTRDDAAVYAIDDRKAIISTTDFFMPIVDDPFDFGGIASVNAISDIYAMGGKPLMAISILGWPVDKLSTSVAREVVEGAREACRRAGIPLAGGHSIDTPEPIFGLAVTGIIDRENVKSNNNAQPGNELYLTKPLGIGILTTAQKRGLLKENDLKKVTELMLTLNQIGYELGALSCVQAMTDVTGFGLLGHLKEMCESSHVSAQIQFDSIPKINHLDYYLEQKTVPGGTSRNYKSYGHAVSELTDIQKAVLCDPQTSGGLLVAVDPAGREEFLATLKRKHLQAESFGQITEPGDFLITVV